eukprot:scaffold66739_cov32-Tisochrysis_lutea.AAC.5
MSYDAISSNGPKVAPRLTGQSRRRCQSAVSRAQRRGGAMGRGSHHSCSLARSLDGFSLIFPYVFWRVLQALAGGPSERVRQLPRRSTGVHDGPCEADAACRIDRDEGWTSAERGVCIPSEDTNFP